MPDVEDESLAEGWLAACMGSGVVASVMEIYGGGSLTQRTAFVAKIREACIKPN